MLRRRSAAVVAVVVATVGRTCVRAADTSGSHIEECAVERGMANDEPALMAMRAELWHSAVEIDDSNTALVVLELRMSRLARYRAAAACHVGGPDLAIGLLPAIRSTSARVKAQRCLASSALTTSAHGQLTSNATVVRFRGESLYSPCCSSTCCIYSTPILQSRITDHS